MSEVTRPTLRWHGGKWKLAPWILAHLPPHRIYVEPFGGAGSVLLRKARCYAEVYNDLDDEVVNLFKVLRDPVLAPRLVTALELTPFARAEFAASNGEPSADPVDRARTLVIRAYMGFGSNAHSSSPVARKNGFRSYTRVGGAPPEPTNGGYRSTGFRSNSSRSGTTPAHDWRNYPEALVATIDRLRGIIIEHRDASEVMGQHDSPETLHYVDPPYLPETRSPANRHDLKHRMYRHELTRTDHIALIAFLKSLAGMVVLSGYPSDLYDRRLRTWRRVETEALADGARKRTEVLWINPAASAALDRARAPLFAGLEQMPALAAALPA